MNNRVFAVLVSVMLVSSAQAQLQRMSFNNPGLEVDLAVGLWAWPLPMDYDGDGNLDLLVSCPDKPYNGTYFFKNPRPRNSGSGDAFPAFLPGVRVGKGYTNIQLSIVDGKPRVLIPGSEIADLHSLSVRKENGFTSPRKIHDNANVHANKVRANQWRYVDFDGDGKLDIVVGVEDWTGYGWDNAYDKQGRWTREPLHGYIYLLRNIGTNESPKYAEPVKIEADGKPIDGFGMPSPCFADFDGDGDLDLITGEFVDGFTYYENIGTRTAPKYAAGRRLNVRMDLEMITPVAIDWNGDGKVDLICGDEDGRVALIENTGKFENGAPVFKQPRYFKQKAAELKFGALVTPFGFDWDGDGKEDLICGNSAGYIGFIRNLGTTADGKTKWDAPVYLEVNGKPIRIMAGLNGSIQGPAEAKWGYTTLSVADWDGDGLPDIIVNSIWGEVLWYRNVGTRTQPKLTGPQPIEVQWPGPTPKPEWTWWEPIGQQLVTQWRTTPYAIDWNKDGLTDLVMLDHEGYLVYFERARRDGKLVLLPPKRIFVDERGEPLRLNSGAAGKSGRRKFCLTDWDGDGKIDLLVDGLNVRWYRNVSAGSAADTVVLKDMGLVATNILAGHDTSPTMVDLRGDGEKSLVVGAEDGHFYTMANPHKPGRAPNAGIKSAEFIYESGVVPETHASTIVETSAGNLVAAWFGGIKEGSDDVSIWVSRRVDGKWLNPVSVANGDGGDKRYPCWNPVLFQPSTGNLMLFYKVGPSPAKWWGMVITSKDGGKTWTKPKRLPDGVLGPIKNQPIQLADGTILSPTSSEDDGWRVHFERSGDLGKTWQIVGPIEGPGAIQPTIITRRDGSLAALCRSQKVGKVLEATSTDGGKTWTKLTETALPNPNSGIDAVTLRDGRHVLIYNHTTRSRSPLNLAISEDDGRTWKAAITLEADPGEYSYPFVIQTKDGLVHIVYTWKRQRVKHVVVDSKDLRGVEIINGEWPK